MICFSKKLHIFIAFMVLALICSTLSLTLAADPKYGGTLRVMADADISSLDPYKIGWQNHEVLRQIFVSDDVDMTVGAIETLIKEGADMIALTGGMSVDPDDQSPSAIRAAGAKVVTYGAPTFPGAMFMLAYMGDIPIVGLPGCVMYFNASIFDLVIPRIVAGETVTRSDIVALGHGGFCSSCAECRYPVCAFGKGG